MKENGGAFQVKRVFHASFTDSAKSCFCQLILPHAKSYSKQVRVHSRQFDVIKRPTTVRWNSIQADYSKPPPIVGIPPPPPPRPGLRKYAYPILLFTAAGTVGYFWLNNNNDNYEFWDAMQTGKELPESAFVLAEDDEDEDDWEQLDQDLIDDLSNQTKQP